MPERIRAVIDTDPGIDDAVAILFALESGLFDIRGLTTVAGNLGIATTTRNAGRLLAFAGCAGVPVVPGAERPLVRKPVEISDIHGDDGVGGVGFPEPAEPPRPQGAVEWLARLLETEPEGSVTILALGPLTNIARLVAEHPIAARRVGAVIAMGGAVHEPGNMGPRAEFNFFADPEAAAAVFAAGLPLVVVPLDVTRKVRATRDYCARLREAGPAAGKCAELIEAYFHTTAGRESRPLHDPCVMLFAARPDLFAVETLRLSIDTTDGPDAGAMVLGDGVAVRVAMKVDGAAALELLARGMKA